MLLRWVLKGWNWLRNLPCRLRLRRWRRGAPQWDVQRLEAALSQLSPDDEARYPATAAHLRLCLCRELVMQAAGERLSQVAQQVAEHVRLFPADWGVTSTPQFVGRIIAWCLDDASGRAPRLHLAKQVFADFRARSAEPVPEAFALALALARHDCEDADARRIYWEFLLCSGRPRKSAEYHRVKMAMERTHGSATLGL